MSSFLKQLGNFSLVSEMVPHLSLYEEVIVMLSGALTVYLVADLRDLARQGKATVDIKDLEPPISLDKILSILKENKTALKECAYEDIEERLTALENLRLHNPVAILNTVFGSSGKVRVVEFEDTNSREELVHSITVNDSQKRITVVFRGSVTTKDFITDAKVSQIKVDNPAFKFDMKASKDTFRLHYGFHEYLFQNTCPNNKGMNRYKGIMLSLKKYLKENPGYKVYCTGHSLGAALCTIFGFYAAADEEITKVADGPIKIISVASPYVGSWKFLMAFQSLERLGKLRHLRIANAEDLVSLMPIAAPKVGTHLHDLKKGNVDFGIADVYRHTGIKLHLNDISKRNIEPMHKFIYPLCQTSDESIADEINILFEDGKNFLSSIKMVLKKTQQADVMRYHSCEEYELRLNEIKDVLQRVTLEDLYNDKAIIGDTLNPGYVPEMLSASETIKRITGSPLLQATIKSMLKKK